MSRGRKRKSKRPSSAALPVATDPAAAQAGSRKLVNGALLAVLALIVTTAAAFSVNPSLFSGSGSSGSLATTHSLRSSEIEAVQLRQDEVEPETLDELLALPADQLAKVDIARMNLLAAEGLPGAEDLDQQTIEQYLARIDQWAEKVRFETERHLYRLTDPRFEDHAEHFEHSEARFRASWLVDVLQRDIGARYHDRFVPADVDVPPFETSKETFIHGLVNHEDAGQAFGGNCVSLPVLYTAVARRLGYPVKLVSSKEHVFTRWVGEDHPNPAWRDTFNFDGAGEGFSIDPDAFYMSWPRPSTQGEVEFHDWFNPLTPEQELGLFLLQRGHILRQVEQDGAAAQVAYAKAYHYWPANHNSLVWLNRTVREQWPRPLLTHPHHASGQQRQQEASREWWRTSQGIDAKFAETQRINEINRRNTQRQQQMYAVPNHHQSAPGAWPGQPQPNPHHHQMPGHPQH